MKITTREANNLLPLVTDAATKTGDLQTLLEGVIASPPGPFNLFDTFPPLRASLEALLNALPSETSSGTGATSIPVAGAVEFRRRVEAGYDEE